MATANPIPSQHAQPFIAKRSGEYLTSGESLCRPVSAPNIASLDFNAVAPDSSLIALAIARTGGAIGIAELVLEQSIPTNAALALEAARDSIEEVQLLLNELQRRSIAHCAETQQ